MNNLPHLLPFLESIGCQFTLDWDDELSVAVPENLSPFDLDNALKPLRAGIVAAIKTRARNALYVCLGGPLDGKRHEWFYNGWGGCTAYKAVKVCRAHWAVYEVHSDGRAIFKGYTTSQKKARQGHVTTASQGQT